MPLRGRLRALRPSGFPSSRGRLWAGLGAFALVACSSPEPRTANPTRPLDERRAIEIILAAFADERDHPVPGRIVRLSQGSELEIDVGSQGKKYGVAYVTTNERVKLGANLPAREPSMGDALQLVSGLGEDSDARVLVLQDSSYLYDDHVGEEHRETTVTAELKLRRDVRDFLVRAHAEKWP
jgi:hypothetical protein